ncbi:MAG TPA: divalent cation tolerance protein CutA, partial [Actinopolymorphaceae bacterium]
AEERECIITFKTTAERVDELAEHVTANHPYDTPELVATPIVAGASDYLSWLREETLDDDDEEDDLDDDLEDLD